ncbi:MAG: flagellar biosynthetic protein FliO [Thermoguttaceae bacterium]|jgi:flagellar biogenesis protein FliO
MLSTARIIGTIFLLLLPGNLPAETSNPPTNQATADEFDSRPPLLEPATEPVRIAPPLAAADKTGDASASGNKPAASSLPLKQESHIPLTPSNKSDYQDSSKKPSGLPSMAAVFGCLGVVLGIFLLIAWMIRRAAPQGLTRLPNEAFEVLGRAPLAGRQNVHLLRCGNKLLLVSITPAGTETLTEIIEPQEVDRMAGLCRQAGPQSTTAAFRRIFEQLAPRRPSRGAFSQSEFVDYDLSGIEPQEAMEWEQRNV